MAFQMLSLISYFICGILFTHAGKQADSGCWTITNNYHYIGLEQSPYHDVESCLNYCMFKQNCYVVDFDTLFNPPCWVQSRSFDVNRNALFPWNSATNYILDKACKVDAVGCWSVTPNHHRLGLEHTQYSDIDSCLDYCVEIDNCYVVDFDTNTHPPCWVQTRPFLLGNKVLTYWHSSTNFVLEESCKNRLKLLKSQPKPKQEVVYTKKVQTCWLTKNNTHYTGGKGLTQTDKETLLDCLQYCILLENCQVVDYDVGTSPPCWVQTGTDKILASAFVYKKTANTYILDRTCLKKGVGTSETYTEEYVYNEEK